MELPDRNTDIYLVEFTR